MVTVVGAGFSGLTVARALLKRGLEVRVVERGPQPGGLIATRVTPDGLIETAAPSLNRTARVEAFLNELGLPLLEPDKASKRRYFWTRGQLRRWPLTPWETAILLAKYPLAKMRGMAPKPGESLRAWGFRCLTPAATDKLLSTAFQGVYAGDARTLSASLLLGHLFRPGREKFRGVIGVGGGMGTLIRALEADVTARGGRIEYNTSLEGEPRPLVWATSAAAVNPRVEMLPVITATLFLEEPSKYRAFGCLVGRGEGLRVLGVLFNHAIFPGRDRLASETWIYGGATDPQVTQLDEKNFFSLLDAERARMFPVAPAVVRRERVVWPQALPNYNDVLENELAGLIEPPGVYYHGNWLGGIGLSRILERSDRLAERILQENQK